jgi:glyoxylase-like metal-dependent hydrolase (beta-lactamase superfamily II)
MVKNLRIIETPGHAPHHLSFSYLGHLFVGEAAGVFISIDSSEYLRPTTPPKFFLDEYLSSIERLLSLPDQPICYVHFGRAENSHELLGRCRNQLILWKKIIREEIYLGEDRLLDRCMHRLFAEDPELDLFKKMDSNSQERERFFSANSVKGFLGYLRASF